MGQALLAKIKLRRNSISSEVGKLAWLFLLLTALLSISLYTGAKEVVISDARSNPAWSIVVQGVLDEEDARLLDEMLKGYDAEVVFASYGSFKQVKSDTASFNFRDDSEISTAPYNSFQLMSRERGQDAAYPWFDNDDVVSGSLDSSFSVVIDANTAHELNVEVGSPIEVEVDISLNSGETQTIAEALTVDAIVKPTLRFEGICAVLPRVEEVLEDEWGIVGNDAFIYLKNPSDLESIKEKLEKSFLTNDEDGVNVISRFADSTWSAEYRLSGWALADEEKTASAIVSTILQFVLIMLFAFDSKRYSRQYVLACEDLAISPRQAIWATVLGRLAFCALIGLSSFCLAWFFVGEFDGLLPWAMRSAYAAPVVLSVAVFCLAAMVEAAACFRCWKTVT